ncbi:MAG: chorismate mutase [Lachnospiraceae bacterium]|nr:chorismate mutase [Lachnospiraceae bacterium]
MTDLEKSREKIDQIDREISRLFEERLDLTDAIGLYKAERGLPVYDPVRENEKLLELAKHAHPDKADDVKELFSKMMEIARTREDRIIENEKKHC